MLLPELLLPVTSNAFATLKLLDCCGVAKCIIVLAAMTALPAALSLLVGDGLLKLGVVVY